MPGSARSGTYTRRSLEPGATYRLTVSGRVRLGGGVASDGQCVSVRGAWYEAASIDPRVPGQDHGNLYVDGAPFSGSTDSGCGSTRVTEFVADTGAGCAWTSGTRSTRPTTPASSRCWCSG